MPLWNFRLPFENAAQWGNTPALRAGEVVRVQTSTGEGEGTAWQARVRTVAGRRIVLDVDGILPARKPLVLFFERGDALYHFETHTLGSVRRGTAVLAFPRRVVRLQRREFYRLLLESPTTLRRLNPDGRGTDAPLPARLINLSGGGALLSLGMGIADGTLVSVRVPIGKGGDPAPLEARVLDCQLAGSSGIRAYSVRLRWTEALDEDDRDAIIAYLHEQQRLMLRARKLLRG